MVSFSAAEPQDAAAVLAYLKQVGGESDNLSFGAEGLPISTEQEAAMIAGMLEQEKELMLLAKDGDRIVGCGTLNGMPRRMAHRGEIGISVLRDYWGQGIGRTLLTMLIDYASQHQMDVLSLEVRSDNTRAIRLYEHAGFRKIGTFPAFFRINGEDISFDFMVLRVTER